MEQLIEFLVNQWVLSVALFVILGLLIGTFVYGGIHGPKKVNPTDATRLINHEDAVVLDVRGDGEYGEGHILNALHIPSSDLSDRIGKLTKYRDRPIIATCRTGQSSASVCTTLRKHGFEKVYALSGGILAWQNANLPLTKK